MIRKIARKAQRAMSTIAGYFAGYLSKVQPVGTFEMRKMYDKMCMLKERLKGKTPGEQSRATVGRALTDLEQNSVLRAAPEHFNLCINNRDQDHLNAECIRTFPTVSLPGYDFLRRLEVELDGAGCKCASVYVPPSRAPQTKRASKQIPMVDIYGYRGRDQRFWYLCPFEFYRC